MATTTNEPVPSSLGHGSVQNSADTSRTDATGVEIPVVVHASRYALASRDANKPLAPLHEQTFTVVIFPQGAVVRLSASLPVGDLVVLTNQQTGADVLCRVAGSKSQPGLHNYVDLEFTQRAPDFWGEGSAISRHNAGALLTPGIAPARQTPSLSLTDTGSLALVTAAPPLPTFVAHGIAIPVTPFQSPFISAGGAAADVSAEPAPSGQMTTPAVFEAGTEHRSDNPRKGLWLAGAAIVVLGLGTAIFLPGRHSPSTPSSEAKTIVASPSVPARPSTTPHPAIAPTVAVTAKSTASDLTADPPSTATQEQASATQPTEQEPESAPDPAPRRRDFALGRFSAPVTNRPVVNSSSEPPPVLLTQGSSTTEAMLGTSLLAGGPGGQLQQPKLLSSSAPIYPQFARSVQLEGVVVMDILVDATGKVVQVNVVSGPVPLQQAAITAIRQWKYQPARLNGQPIAIHTKAQVTFTIQ